MLDILILVCTFLLASAMAVLTTQTPTLHTELVSLLSSLAHFTPTLTNLGQERQDM